VAVAVVDTLLVLGTHPLRALPHQDQQLLGLLVLADQVALAAHPLRVTHARVPLVVPAAWVQADKFNS
jgi:hypothetical protein